MIESWTVHKDGVSLCLLEILSGVHPVLGISSRDFIKRRRGICNGVIASRCKGAISFNAGALTRLISATMILIVTIRVILVIRFILVVVVAAIIVLIIVSIIVAVVVVTSFVIILFRFVLIWS